MQTALNSRSIADDPDAIAEAGAIDAILRDLASLVDLLDRRELLCLETGNFLAGDKAMSEAAAKASGSATFVAGMRAALDSPDDRIPAPGTCVVRELGGERCYRGFNGRSDRARRLRHAITFPTFSVLSHTWAAPLNSLM